MNPVVSEGLGQGLGRPLGPVGRVLSSGPTGPPCQVLLRREDNVSLLFFQLSFYYGKTDGWCPVKYYEDMKKDFPEGNIYLCEKGIPHAFVLGFNQEMATIVADWINNNLPRK